MENQEIAHQDKKVKAAHQESSIKMKNENQESSSKASTPIPYLPYDVRTIIWKWKAKAHMKARIAALEGKVNWRAMERGHISSQWWSTETSKGIYYLWNAREEERVCCYLYYFDY